MTVAWGILSTAAINRKVLEGAALSDRVEILAVASRNTENAESYAQQHGIERAYGSYEGLLQDPDIEAVYISLPNSMHLDWSVRALRSGKHVLCEKPLSTNVTAVSQAFDVADAEGMLFSEAFMWRHNPITKQIVGLIEAGAIGDLALVRACFGHDIRRLGDDDVRVNAELEGGALMDVGCYCVSAARLLAGEPEVATALQRTGKSGVDVLMVANMRHRNGVLSTFDTSFIASDRDELEIIGNDGSLFIDDPFHLRTPVIELRTLSGVELITGEPANNYQLELENLSDALRGTAPLLLGRQDAEGQARAIAALYRSAAEGRAVEVK